MDIGEIEDWFNNAVLDPLWIFIVALLVVTAIILYSKTRAAPISMLGHAAREISHSSKKRGDGISTFGAFCNSLCTHVGTGNILGVSFAIITGGTGALFWMWIFGIIAASLVFAECVIGQLYKERMSDGMFRGGPAYFIRKGLNNHKLSLAYALFSILLSLFACGVFVGNMNDVLKVSFDVTGNSAIIMGLIVTGVVSFIIINRIDIITKVTSQLIPFLCGIWIIVCVLILVLNFSKLPDAISSVFVNAFSYSSIIGAAGGSAIIVGFKRGAYCSDAGHGQISPTSSEADNSHPCIQGFVQSFGLFLDIFVICTLSALLVITCGGPFNSDTLPAEFVLNSLQNGLFGSAAPYFLIFIMCMLGLSSSIGNYLCAESNVHIISDSKRGVNILRVCFVLVMVFSVLVPIQLIFDIADLFVGVLSVICCGVLIYLMKYLRPIISDYNFKKRNGHESPRFDLTVLKGLDKNGITAWPRGPDRK